MWNNKNNSVWDTTKEWGQHLGIKAMSMWNEWEAVQCIRSNTAQTEQQKQNTQRQKPNKQS
jgi:hypothetical protein